LNIKLIFNERVGVTRLRSFPPSRRMNSIVSAAKAAATITAGRRAGAPTTLNTAALSSNSPSKEGDELALSSTNGGTATSGRRSGGAPPATSWGSETTGATGPAFGQTGATSSVKVNQRAEAAAAATSNDDGAVVIRDDTETIDTEAGQTTSAAPRNQARRVQSLFELQEQSGSGGLDSRTNTSKNGNSGGSFASGLDLSLLTSVMSPPDALKEPDEVWVYSKLLQKLSQDIQNEEEDKNEIT